MTVKIRFNIYRKRDLNGGPHRSVALVSPGGRFYTMNDLQYIVDHYAIRCEPKFIDPERPAISHFVIEFEDHMYNAFIIAET